MAFSGKTNAKDLIERLKKKGIDILGEASKGMENGMRGFESKIIKEQMSGRPGLKTQTGRLKGSWVVRTTGKDERFRVILGTRTKYAISHQLGLTIRPRVANFLKFKINGQFVMTKQVKIPKRLFIIEDFKRSGVKIIANEARRRVNAILKRKFSS